MKKQYLLVLVASVALGMGAEAQTRVTPSIDPSSLNTEEIASSTVKTGNGSALSATPRQAASGSLLRSTAEQLPDSMVTYNARGIRAYLNTYKYTDAGQIAEMWYYEWDAEKAEWGMDKATYNTYSYDANGNQTGQIYREWEGSGYVEKQFVTRTFDERNRILVGDIRIPEDNRHVVDYYTYEGNQCTYERRDSTLFENGSTSTRQKYLYTYDNAGNTIQEISYGGSWNEETEEVDWYEAVVWNHEYDALNRTIASDMVNYDSDGEILRTYDLTYEYADEGTWNYTRIQYSKEASALNPTYLALKYEREEGNPAIYTCTQQNMENGPWATVATYYYYYPETVANEAIEENAAPDFRVWTANGSLTIQTSEARAVQVYSVNGVCHYNATVSGSVTISNLPAGIYVVTTGDKTQKVSVR